MKQGTLPKIAPKRRRLVLSSGVCNKRNIVVEVGTILLYWGVKWKHVMEMQEIEIVGESIKLALLVLYGERFWPFSRIWEIWSMDEFVHFKGGSSLWGHLTHGKENDMPRSGFRTKWVRVLSWYVGYPKNMKGWSTIGYKGGRMSVIWSKL